jgi:hypothetical protein
MIDVGSIRARYAALSPPLDERGRRVFAATEAKTAGYGGIAAVSLATGIAASTIGRGLRELAATDKLDLSRVRRPGGQTGKWPASPLHETSSMAIGITQSIPDQSG